MNNKDIRDAFFDEVYEIASRDKNVIFISADADAFSLKRYKRELPDQFINVGVAEQNMVLLATGLALSGKKVFIYSITPFITMRCFEQLKVNVCSMNLNVSIVGVGCGFSFSYDGPTHHATQDIAIMRTLPEVTILNPCDEQTAQQAAITCYEQSTPTFVRIDKGAYNKLYNKKECNDGLKEVSNKSRIKIISSGYMTHKSLEIVKELEEAELLVDVVDLYKLKPLNESAIIDIIEKSDFIFTIEENTYIGGIGSMVCEVIADNNLNVKLKRLALNDEQVLDFGDRDWLIEKSGLGREKIINSLKGAL